MRGWALVVLIPVILLAVLYRIDTSDVFIYPTNEQVTVSAAAPGELSELVGEVIKLRGECIVRATHTDTIVTDVTGNSFIVNQRSGMRLSLPAGQHTIRLHFEVPRLAQPGPATVVFDNTYMCLVFSVSQKTPEYSFEVLPNE